METSSYVNAIFDDSNLSEESKLEETAKAMEVQKCVFGLEFPYPQ